jgi:hypothetical protein
VATGLAVTVLATSALAGVLAISYGFPRRLVGAGSVFTTSEWDTRFLRRPQWADEFHWAADAVSAANARRIGLVQQSDNWEYPWWLLLRDADGRPPELLALQSVLSERPPADPASMDAIVCTGSRPACTKLVPATSATPCRPAADRHEVHPAGRPPARRSGEQALHDISTRPTATSSSPCARRIATTSSRSKRPSPRSRTSCKPNDSPRRPSPAGVGGPTGRASPCASTGRFLS